LDLLNLNL